MSSAPSVIRLPTTTPKNPHAAASTPDMMTPPRRGDDAGAQLPERSAPRIGPNRQARVPASTVPSEQNACVTFERHSARDRAPATRVGTVSAATPSSSIRPEDGTFGMQRSAGNAAVTELLRARPGVQRAASADEVAAGSASLSV